MLLKEQEVLLLIFDLFGIFRLVLCNIITRIYRQNFYVYIYISLHSRLIYSYNFILFFLKYLRIPLLLAIFFIKQECNSISTKELLTVRQRVGRFFQCDEDRNFRECRTCGFKITNFTCRKLHVIHNVNCGMLSKYPYAG